jgi:hypothetical protein
MSAPMSFCPLCIVYELHWDFALACLAYVGTIAILGGPS